MSNPIFDTVKINVLTMDFRITHVYTSVLRMRHKFSPSVVSLRQQQRSHGRE